MATRSRKRQDADGRAYAGSQLQMQLYVNRRRGALDSAIREAIPSLGPRAHIEWHSPLEGQPSPFREFRDGAFLRALGLAHLRTALRKFWPLGGPRWDGLATAQDPKSAGVIAYLLVEAKSYPDELLGRGCLALPDSDADRLIEESLARTARWAGVADNSRWRGHLYQYANRLAHMYFLQEATGVSTWLVNLCFLNDQTNRPTPRAEWDTRLKQLKAELGFPDAQVPRSVDVFLPAGSREDLLAPRV
jgi:hypothetical protein